MTETTKLMTTKFQRKPFYVEATQVDANNLRDVAEWCGGQIRHTRGNAEEKVEPAPYVKVCVLNPKSERQTRAYIGDWVLKAGSGFKVYSDKSFRQAFVVAPIQVQEDHNYGEYLAETISKNA